MRDLYTRLPHMNDAEKGGHHILLSGPEPKGLNNIKSKTFSSRL
jgi:hypothetical protein